MSLSPTPPPPPPRTASEERYQLLEARITSLADEIAHVRAHQRAERLTIDSYFQHLSSQIQCLLTQSGVQFPPYTCPSFFTTTSFEEQYSRSDERSTGRFATEDSLLR